MLVVKVNPDTETAKFVRQKLKENDNYCPCSIVRSPDTKCMCKEFRESNEPGECHCGLYVKVESEEK